MSDYQGISKRLTEQEMHPKCRGYEHHDYSGLVYYDCGYESELDCGECKYGSGRKDPEAKCNQT